jgi:hypothetical protein
VKYGRTAIIGSIMVADLRSRPSNGAKMFNVVRNSEWKSSKRHQKSA